MRRPFAATLMMFLCAVGLVRGADSGTDAPPSPAQIELATQYVTAINAKDPDKLKAIIHPQCLASLTPEVGAIMDQMRAVEFSRTIPLEYKVRVTPVQKQQLESVAAFGTLAVTPTHNLHVEWTLPPNNPNSTTFFIAQQNEKWFQVTLTPSEETLKRVRDQKKQTSPTK